MSLHSIYFLVAWASKKQRTWSGTCWGLFQALSSITDVRDICITVPTPLIIRLLRKLHLMKDDSDIHRLKKQRAIASPIIKEEGHKDALIQFGDVIDDSCGTPTYLYIDMSADAMVHLMKSDPSTFSVSGRQVCSAKTLIKRASIQNKYFENCSGVFTMGQWMADDLIHRQGIAYEKVHHVGGGVNVDISQVDYSQKKGNKFLFVGRDFIRKNGPLVYQAFRLLHQKHPEWELHIAGPKSNPYPNDSTDQFFFHGDCEGKSLATLYNLCDVFVMPSRFEAYGLVFIEALTYGLPCIGRKAYEMPYFIQDGVTGRLLEDQEPQSLALLMEEVMTNHDYFTNVRGQRDYYTREYSWDCVVSRILAAV